MGPIELDEVTSLDVFNSIALLIFTSAMLFNATVLVARLIRYQRLRRRAPVLLWRDAALMLGLAVPLTAVMFARMSGLNVVLGRNPWWLIPTSGLAVVGVLIFTYFEVFVVERTKRIRDAFYDPYGVPFGDVSRRPWESPATSASDPADTPTPQSEPPPGDESGPRS